jgi:hypothetical protein
LRIATDQLLAWVHRGVDHGMAQDRQAYCLLVHPDCEIQMQSMSLEVCGVPDLRLSRLSGFVGLAVFLDERVEPHHALICDHDWRLIAKLVARREP